MSIGPNGEVDFGGFVPYTPIQSMLAGLLHPSGYIPLIVLLLVFFLIKRYDTQNKYLNMYLIASIVLYLIYLYVISPAGYYTYI